MALLGGVDFSLLLLVVLVPFNDSDDFIEVDTGTAGVGNCSMMDFVWLDGVCVRLCSSRLDDESQ